MLWPESELTGPDPMMEELRQIRDEIGAFAWSLPPDEMCRWYNAQAEEAASSIGCELQPHPTLPQMFRFVPKSPSEST